MDLLFSSNSVLAWRAEREFAVLTRDGVRADEDVELGKEGRGDVGT